MERRGITIRIGGRLALGYSAIVVLMAAIAVISYLNISRLNSTVDHLYAVRVPAVDALDQADRDMQQLLVAERTMLTAKPGTTAFQQQVSDYNENRQQSRDRLALFAKLVTTSKEKDLLAGYAAARAKWIALSGEVVKLASSFDTGDLAKAKALSLGDAGTAFEKTRNYLNDLEDFELAYVKQLHESSDATYSQTVYALIALSFAAIILTIIIAMVLTRGITRPLNKVVRYAETVAEGNLTEKLDIRRRDEMGTLVGALNGMSARLAEMISQIREAANNVASSSDEIASGARQLSEGAQNQASTLEETSASVEELTVSVEQVAGHAQSQAASAEGSSSNMEQMRESVEQVSKTLVDVAGSSEKSMTTAQAGMAAVSKAVEAITSISTSSEQIAGIVTVISDIADQTNLLALNASIEAARAGEHGRGFAVVADEVSKLADRSASSTREIGTLIEESTKSVNQGVDIAQAALGSMEEIIAGARKTNEMVTTLAEDVRQQVGSIKEMTKATESINEMSRSISAATEEQTTNARQVAKAVENVNELTQQAASAAEEMSAATEELSTLSGQLRALVQQFRLAEETSPGRLTAKPSVQRRRRDGDGWEYAKPEETGVVLKKGVAVETVRS